MAGYIWRTVIATLWLISSCAVSTGNADLSTDQDPITATVDGKPIDFNKPARIFVVGTAHGLGYMLIQVALDRAYRYLTLFPNDQVVFYATGEEGTAEHLKQLGTAILGVPIQIVTINGVLQNQILRAEELIANFALYTKIASIDFFTHQAVYLGPRLEEPGYRDNWFRTDRYASQLAALAPRFLPTAYVMLNGCNGGAHIAPHLSQLWEVPVSGAITSTRFENLYADGDWYVNYPGQFPPSINQARTNTVSYAVPRPCPGNTCRRMKPENVPYAGLWGDFRQTGGLPFFKFFCNYSDSNNECKKAIALSLYGFVSTTHLDSESTKAQFESVVLDFLCPSDGDQLKENCYQSVREASHNDVPYSPFAGAEPRCELEGCDFELECDENYFCRSYLTAPNPEPDNIVSEYMLYLNGFDELEAVSFF